MIGQKLTEGGIDPAASFGYRGPYLRAKTDYGNGLSGARQFDGARRMVSDTLTTSGGSKVFDESLSWSPRNLKVAQSRGDLNGVGFAFDYDGARRIQQAAKGPTINRDIFMDLAWHHKAYAEKGIDEIEERWAAREIDYEATEGWRLVDQGRRAGDSERIMGR